MAADPLKRNAVTVIGEGSPVLLAHGFGCDQTMWQPLTHHLKGHQLIQYDLTGMGASDYKAYDPARHKHLQGHADDLIEILDAAGAKPVVGVGHSVSAMIVAMAAAKRPDLFRAIVMVCPNPFYLQDGDYDGGFSRETIDGLLAAIEDNYVGWSGQLASLVGGDEQTSEVLRRQFCRNDPGITQHFAATTFLSDGRPVVDRIPVPTLLIEADQDAIAPARVGDYMAQHVPDNKRAIISCFGHAPHMSHPRETAGHIEQFIQDLRT